MRESKTPQLADKGAFKDAIDKTIDSEQGSDKNLLIESYLMNLCHQDRPNCVIHYSKNLLELIAHIKIFQKVFAALKATECLAEARIFAQQYLHQIKLITHCVEEIYLYSNQLHSSTSSSSSFFHVGSEVQRKQLQMESMREQLYLLSPYVEFLPGKNFAEFYREFKNTLIEAVQVVAAEIQDILLLVNSSIKVKIDQSSEYPVLILQGVN